jgi:hypothetical protein
MEHDHTTSPRTGISEKAIDQGTLLPAPDHTADATGPSEQPARMAGSTSTKTGTISYEASQ